MWYIHFDSFAILPETFVTMFAVFYEFQSIVCTPKFDKTFYLTSALQKIRL